MSTSGIQFRGVSAVMAAYDNIKIIAWAVMYGKNINMKYVGTNFAESRDALKIFLDQLKSSETTATYTLHLYEDLPKNAKIKVSTEPDYSFNFLVTDDEAPRFARYREADAERRTMLDKITELEARLKARDEEDEYDDEPEGIGAVINGILGDEKVKEWIRTKAIGWADSLINKKPEANIISMNQGAAKVGAISSADPILINEEQQQKLQQAIEILARCDSSLGDNLLKIAKIAENDPGKYQLFSKML